MSKVALILFEKIIAIVGKYCLQHSHCSKKNNLVFASAPNVEILNPEFANFSSSPPLLLEGKNIESELSHALSYLRDLLDEPDGNGRKYCIAICGQAQSEVENLGEYLSLPVLNGDTDVIAGQIFLSDLEQTKGFEFDSVVIINCSSKILPHPALPAEESYRDLCKLYVAMTRAKTELIISFAGAPSHFLENSKIHFTEGAWSTYATPTEIIKNGNDLALHNSNTADDIINQSAEQILFSKEAIGLSTVAQEKLMQIVTGTNRFENRKKVGWKNFSEFHAEVSRSGILRHFNGISDQVWSEFDMLSKRLKSASMQKVHVEDKPNRRILSLPKRP